MRRNRGTTTIIFIVIYSENFATIPTYTRAGTRTDTFNKRCHWTINHGSAQRYGEFRWEHCDQHSGGFVSRNHASNWQLKLNMHVQKCNNGNYNFLRRKSAHRVQYKTRNSAAQHDVNCNARPCFLFLFTERKLSKKVHNDTYYHKYISGVVRFLIAYKYQDTHARVRAFRFLKFRLLMLNYYKRGTKRFFV